MNYLATHEREHLIRELGDCGIFGEAAFRVPNFPGAGTWPEWMGKSEVEVAESTLVLDLPESEAKVFICR